MNNRLYKRAYRFLKLRTIGQNPFKAIESLNLIDKDKVIDFLKYNHQIRFI